MKRNNTADRITARCLAGHATEMMVWQMVRDLSVQLASIHDKGGVHGCIMLDNIIVEGKNFILSDAKSSKKAHNTSTADDVWQLGACIYEMITGNAPFGGKGREGQNALSPLPVFSESKVSAAVSQLFAKCIANDADKRISINEIAHIATQELQRCKEYYSDAEHLKYNKPQNRHIRMKTYDFWPETMASIVLIIMLALPQRAVAQYNVEMEKLIRLTTTMRDQSKRSQVLKELKEDDKWTLMDEIKVDMNECSFQDKVNMFGVNDIAAEIMQREKGIINTGGRFKHSADGTHHYSFIELTAYAGTTISYTVKGHAGIQQIAVIPFDSKSNYTAACYTDDKETKAHTVKDGISYFSVGVGKRGQYEFEISNKDKKNASYVVITYNPMK